MNGAVEVLLRHGYWLLLVVVLAEQIGLPIPAVPVLLGVGALSGHGKMSLAIALGVAVVASLPPDLIWYELGRRRGSRVLGVLCRVSLEPDSCVRRTENLFIRHGRRTLLIAKFLPGLSTIAPPLAGIVGIARGQFVLLDTLSAIIWAGDQRPGGAPAEAKRAGTGPAALWRPERLDGTTVPCGEARCRPARRQGRMTRLQNGQTAGLRTS